MHMQMKYAHGDLFTGVGLNYTHVPPMETASHYD